MFLEPKKIVYSKVQWWPEWPRNVMNEESTRTCLWHANRDLFFQCKETARALSQVTLKEQNPQSFPPQYLQMRPNYRERWVWELCTLITLPSVLAMGGNFRVQNPERAADIGKTKALVASRISTCTFPTCVYIYIGDAICCKLFFQCTENCHSSGRGLLVPWFWRKIMKALSRCWPTLHVFRTILRILTFHKFLRNQGA